jgi:putative tricarboxylic transport membrane protein
MNIKSLLGILIITTGIAVSTPVLADYPEKPVTLICWSSAGSGHDLMARMIAKIGEEYLGQPIVVVNKVGGSGKVAMSYVLGQKTDGYMMMTNTRSMTELFPDPGGRLSIDDFKYVSRVVRDPFVMVVNQDSPFKTIEDLVAHARGNPNKVTMGGFSIKSVDESLVKDFEVAAEIDVNYIPYRGGSEPVVAVLGGHIDVAIANPSEMIANYKAEKLRVLALATPERFSPFDDVPTFAEKGYSVITEHWRGVMAAKNVSDEVVAKWNEVLAKVVVHPEFQQFMSNANMYNGYLPGDEFADLVIQQTSQ